MTPVGKSQPAKVTTAAVAAAAAFAIAMRILWKAFFWPHLWEIKKKKKNHGRECANTQNNNKRREKTSNHDKQLKIILILLLLLCILLLHYLLILFCCICCISHFISPFFKLVCHYNEGGWLAWLDFYKHNNFMKSHISLKKIKFSRFFFFLFFFFVK